MFRLISILVLSAQLIACNYEEPPPTEDNVLPPELDTGYYDGYWIKDNVGEETTTTIMFISGTEFEVEHQFDENSDDAYECRRNFEFDLAGGDGRYEDVNTYVIFGGGFDDGVDSPIPYAIVYRYANTNMLEITTQYDYNITYGDVHADIVTNFTFLGAKRTDPFVRMWLDADLPAC